MFDLTGFQRDLLYCIAGLDDPYGLEIKRKLEAETGTEINHGRLYPNLDDLVEEGYLEKSSIDDRTNSYVLTEGGKQLLADRRDWEAEHLGGTIEV